MTWRANNMAEMNTGKVSHGCVHVAPVMSFTAHVTSGMAGLAVVSPKAIKANRYPAIGSPS